MRNMEMKKIFLLISLMSSLVLSASYLDFDIAYQLQEQELESMEAFREAQNRELKRIQISKVSVQRKSDKARLVSFIKEANSSDEESIAQKSKRQRQGEFGQQIQDQKKRFLEEVVFGSVIPKVEIFI
jgi:Cft2 family RNA processing exonuclease